MLALLDHIRAVEAERDDLQHIADDDWKCDGCGEWFAQEIDNLGTDCNLCGQCLNAEIDAQEGR